MGVEGYPWEGMSHWWIFTDDNVSISTDVRLIHEHHDPPAHIDTLCITAEDTAADGIQPEFKATRCAAFVRV